VAGAKGRLQRTTPLPCLRLGVDDQLPLEHSGQGSIQNESRLKPYWASPDVAGEAPLPVGQTTMRGRQHHGPQYKVVVPQAGGGRGSGSIRRYQGGTK